MSRCCVLAALTVLVLTALGDDRDYQIPNVELAPSGDGFNIFIPDVPDVVRSVNYILEVNNKCPALRNHLLEPNQGTWTFKENVHKGDHVKVSLFVEVDGRTLKKYSEILVSEKGVAEDVKSAESPNLCQPKDECQPTETTFLGKKANCAGDLMFEETFNGSELNKSVWTHEIRGVVLSENSEYVAYDNRPENCYIEGGKLILKAIWNTENKGVDLWHRCTSLIEPYNSRVQQCQYDSRHNHKLPNPPAFSSKIHTKQFVSCKYCRMEVRAKLPIGDFLFPYILLQPKSRFTENAFVNHTRIAARGNRYLESNCNGEQMDGRILSGDIIFWDNKNIKHSRIDRKYRATEHYGEKFHNYTIHWQSNSIHFEVDGSKFGVVDTTNLNSYNNEEFFIVLGLTVGGDINFPNVNSRHAMGGPTSKPVNKFHSDKKIRRTWHQPTLEVDHVRIYATEKQG